jgi:hypothetical protein
MASPITWSEFPAAWTGLACQQCRTQIAEGQPYLIRSFGRRYARAWCLPCKARLDEVRTLDVLAATA